MLRERCEGSSRFATGSARTATVALGTSLHPPTLRLGGTDPNAPQPDLQQEEAARKMREMNHPNAPPAVLPPRGKPFRREEWTVSYAGGPPHT